MNFISYIIISSSCPDFIKLLTFVSHTLSFSSVSVKILIAFDVVKFWGSLFEDIFEARLFYREGAVVYLFVLQLYEGSLELTLLYFFIAFFIRLGTIIPHHVTHSFARENTSA